MPIEGLLGRKLGMTQVFDSTGKIHAVTVVEAGPMVVTQVKTSSKDGYDAVQVGYGEKKKINEPMRGHLKGLPRFVVRRIVPPRCAMPRTDSRVSDTTSSSPSNPANPRLMPRTSQFRLSAVSTTARITALSPGASPPPVEMPSRMPSLRKQR